MGVATLGGWTFRVDPQSVSWPFSMKTAVTDTLGGKVVQLYGVQLGDITVSGSFGRGGYLEQKAFLTYLESNTPTDIQIQTSGQQTGFFNLIKFTYPPKNWDFNVYLKSFSEAGGSGTSIDVTPNNFNPKWTIVLFPNQSNNEFRAAAIDAAISHTQTGFGWDPKEYQFSGVGIPVTESAATLQSYAQEEAALQGSGAQSVNQPGQPGLLAGYPNAEIFPGLFGKGGSATLTSLTSGSPGQPSIGPVGSINNPTDFANALLAAIGAPSTAANITSIVNWEAREGGNWNNTAKYNPINTTLNEPGATSINSVGVKAYTSWAQGVQATAATLLGGQYNDIVTALRAGNGLGHGSYAGLSTWSGGGYSSI
jgi:hypothetical protein